MTTARDFTEDAMASVGDRAAEDYTRRLAASLTLHEDVLKHRSRLYRVMQVRRVHSLRMISPWRIAWEPLLSR